MVVKVKEDAEATRTRNTVEADAHAAKVVIIPGPEAPPPKELYSKGNAGPSRTRYSTTSAYIRVPVTQE